jgi:hypothetical protein
MNKSLSESITQSRRLLKNPYAYLDDLGGYSALPYNAQQNLASSDEITKDRQLKQNQYAHLDEFGGFSALSNNVDMQFDAGSAVPQKITGKYCHSHAEIEQQVRDLHRSMWKNKSKIWGNSIPSNPIDMLDPIVALKLIGYDCDLDETLGQFRSGGKLIEVAGTIDRASARVRISRQFQQNIRSFTAAHELGHALLHQTNGLHRDKPLNGETISRDPVELEADKFATLFLMPQNLVKTTLKKFFLTDKFCIDEATAHALGQGDFVTLKKKCKTLRHLSRLLADAEQYNGLHFTSLAKQFRVSTEAMAIRLEELELVAL